jgi:hypothetical protein
MKPARLAEENRGIEGERARKRCRKGGRVRRGTRSGEDVLVTLQQNEVRNTGEQVLGRAANLAKFAEAALAFAEHPRSSSKGRRLEHWPLRAEMALERAWELLAGPDEENV